MTTAGYRPAYLSGTPTTCNAAPCAGPDPLAASCCRESSALTVYQGDAASADVAGIIAAAGTPTLVLLSATRSKRRRLSAAKAVEQLPGRGEPTAHLWGNHLLMALVEAEDGSEALQRELRVELAKVSPRPRTARLSARLRPDRLPRVPPPSSCCQA